MRSVRVCLLMAAFAGSGGAASGQSSLSGATLHITRATSAIRVDGDLSDEAWCVAARIETWYDVSPGDNAVPPVKSVGYLTYDDRFFYVAFEFDDPDPCRDRTP